MSYSQKNVAVALDIGRESDPMSRYLEYKPYYECIGIPGKELAL
jgi:hypothetical protein